MEFKDSSSLHLRHSDFIFIIVERWSRLPFCQLMSANHNVYNLMKSDRFTIIMTSSFEMQPNYDKTMLRKKSSGDYRSMIKMQFYWSWSLLESTALHWSDKIIYGFGQGCLKLRMIVLLCWTIILGFEHLMTTSPAQAIDCTLLETIDKILYNTKILFKSSYVSYFLPYNGFFS